MSLGNKIKEIRNRFGYSQDDLASLINVSRQAITKWENDNAYPEMTRLLFMSDFFNVSLDYLIRGIEETENSHAATTYKARTLLTVWNSFVSNLSNKQRRLLMILYILLVFVCIAIVVSFIYGMGYVIGEAIAHIQNSLN